MDYNAYRLIHFAGLMLVFLGFGSLLFHGKGKGERSPKAAMILHGIGLLVMLTGGFGMLARLNESLPDESKNPNYVWAKVGIWVVLGLLPVLHRKAKLPGAVTCLIAIALAGAAAYTAIHKSFFGLL
ncbi:MAG: hypothetical protein AAF196_12280 [Planctomycetota bacterium]